MIKALVITLILLVVPGCRTAGSLPAIISETQVSMQERACAGLYVNGKWQFIHSIEALFKGRKSFFTGITVVSSDNRAMKCAIMTTEGFVLFEAVYNSKGMHIIRAVPPFDSGSFARGLMEDIGLMFFMPQGCTMHAGYMEDGSFVCRCIQLDNGTVDIVRHPDAGREIRQYDKNRELVRVVRFSSVSRLCKGQRIPETITLCAYGQTDYKLVMHLVSAIEKP